MSQNSGDKESLIGLYIICIIGVTIFYLFIIAYALAVFAAIIMTIICMCAWDKTVTIGPFTLSPDEARDFVKRGLWGALYAPAFVIFVDLLFGPLGIPGSALLHIVLAGYTAGSLGIEYLKAQAAEEQRQAQELLPPAPPPARIAPPQGFYPPAKTDAASPPSAPFRFATWDDEEEMRRRARDGH